MHCMPLAVLSNWCLVSVHTCTCMCLHVTFMWLPACLCTCELHIVYYAYSLFTCNMYVASCISACVLVNCTSLTFYFLCVYVFHPLVGCMSG